MYQGINYETLNLYYPRYKVNYIWESEPIIIFVQKKRGGHAKLS